MKRTLVGLMLCGLILGMVSCAKLDPGANTFLTRSEQALDVTFWTVDALFQIEKAGQPELDQWLPGTHAKVNAIRTKAPAIFKGAMLALDMYRAAAQAGNKNPDKTQVTVALSAADVLAQEASLTMSEIHNAQQAHGKVGVK